MSLELAGTDFADVRLPPFLVESEMGNVLNGIWFETSASTFSRNLRLHWNDVLFFDASAILTLLAFEQCWIRQGFRVKHLGISRFQCAQVAVQLHAIGYSELLLSNSLSCITKDRIGDLKEFTAANPLSGIASGVENADVMRITACCDDFHFRSHSREYEKIQGFCSAHAVGSFLTAVEDAPRVWDLVESGDFRAVILEQTRINVPTHAKPFHFGFSAARILTRKGLSTGWGLSESDVSKLLSKDSRISQMLRKLTGDEDGVLEVVTIDDGVGVPTRLKDYFPRAHALNLEGIAPVDSEHEFLINTGAWNSPIARLCSFATHDNGSSKGEQNRSSEGKGLTRIRAKVKDLGGALEIVSDGGGVLFEDFKTTPWGRELPNTPRWCKEGGTRISVYLPVRKRASESGIGDASKKRFYIPHRARHETLAEVLVHDEWRDCAVGNRQLVEISTVCSQKMLAHLVGADGNTQPVVFDWEDMPFDKDIVSSLLCSFANGLPKLGKTTPFVFINLQDSICVLVREGFDAFAKAGIPVLVVTSSQSWHWVGLLKAEDPEIRQLAKAGKLSQIGLTRQITIDNRIETWTQAVERACLDALLRAQRKNIVPRQWPLSPAFRSRLSEIFQSCSLFLCEPLNEGVQAELFQSFAFSPSLSLLSLMESVRKGFRNRLKDCMQVSPVIRREEGGIKTTTGHVVRDFYRCDFLIDTDIAPELAAELAHHANAIADTSTIDFVIGCTPPTTWFVERIADSLRDHNIPCRSYVFRQADSIDAEIQQLPNLRHASVLIFTDVLATGSLLKRLAAALTKAGARLSGALVLADTRTQDEICRQQKDRTSAALLFPEGRFVELIHLPVKREPPGTRSEYCVNPVTLTVDPLTRQNDELTLRSNSAEQLLGNQPVGAISNLFGNAEELANQLDKLKAVRIGHIAHGRHHSEAVCDVRRLLRADGFRSHLATSLVAYVLENDIQLIITPNHSNVYLLRDELVERFRVAGSVTPPQGVTPSFVTACISENAPLIVNYYIPLESPQIKKAIELGTIERVMILDDGVITGATARSLVNAVVSVAREGKVNRGRVLKLHLLCVVNGMRTLERSWWESLELLTGGNISFVYFISFLTRGFPDAYCPICLKQEGLQLRACREDTSLYEREFLEEWAEDLKAVELHDKESSGRASVRLPRGAVPREVATCLSTLYAGDLASVLSYIEAARSYDTQLFLLGRLIECLAKQNHESRFQKQVLGFIERQLPRFVEEPANALILVRAVVPVLSLPEFSSEAKRVVLKCMQLLLPRTSQPSMLGALAFLASESIEKCSNGNVTDEERSFGSELVGTIDAALAQILPGRERVQCAWLRVHATTCRQRGSSTSIGHAVLRLVEYNTFLTAHRSLTNSIWDLRQCLDDISRSDKTDTSDVALQNANALTILVSNAFSEVFSALKLLANGSGRGLAILQEILSAEPELPRLQPFAIKGEGQAPVCARDWASDVRASLGALQESLRGLPPTRLVRIIEQYTVRPYAAIQKAMSALQDSWQVSIVGAQEEWDDLEVVCDPLRFSELIEHILYNFRTKAIDSSATGSWSVQTKQSDNRLVCLAFDTDRTSPVGEPVKYSGLKPYRRELNDFGGDLDVRPLSERGGSRTLIWCVRW